MVIVRNIVFKWMVKDFVHFVIHIDIFLVIRPAFKILQFVSESDNLNTKHFWCKENVLHKDFYFSR